MALTALKVKNAKPGRHVDGRGLCLLVKESGAATWVLRMQHKGRRRDYGLGSALDVSLVEAREAATALRSKVRAGADPVAERRKARKVIPSFETAARDCYDALKEGWKNRRYANWISSFENHVFPHIGTKPVDQVDSACVVTVLSPIWLEIPETARRLLQRIGAVLDFAHIKGWRAEEASLRSVRKGLPRQTAKAVHLEAMPFAEVPALMVQLAAASPTRIILSHTNDEVRELNDAARGRLRDAGELGMDVSISATRGERQFASGDRIMFLRNERGLGVKNGTLGTVERISAQSMAVRTDDGRSVAFDTKNYAHIDHGYAATIHKAQGMTVDRTHVLATPGMDSRGAYVAMSRHRDVLALHYGRDDFADQSKLVRTLSRERGKDMASDYKPEQQFAERRGITFRERIVEIARQLPERAKSIFAGFRPQANRLEALPTEQAGPSDQRRAVERYVSAANDIGQMREQGLPVLPHQRDALEKAGKALDAIRAHGTADLASALQRQPSLARDAADGRSQGAMRAMQLEAEIRVDPAQRADRFVSDWQRLGQARQAMQRDGDTKGAQSLTNRMTDMVKGLGRDAQVEALLRSRTRELGIKSELGRDLARDLAASISMERSRSIGLGL